MSAFAFLFFILSNFLLSSIGVNSYAESYERLFDAWTTEHGIQFSDHTQKGAVFEKWVDNHIYIKRVNALNLTYTLGHNRFSGMDSADFGNWLNRAYSPPHTDYIKYYVEVRVGGLPESVDWTEKGVVTPVKDQGQCGSCWSFSTTGALEGAYAIKTGELASFSEQQLVDCDTLGNGGKDHGCNGGLMDNAFHWIMKNDGLCLETDYPYVSGSTKTAGPCKTSCKVVQGSDIETFVDIKANSDEEFVTALTRQPIAVAIEADQREFQLYKSGILTSNCGTNLDHGVLAVGYGTDTSLGLEYYKVKNSWSETWGEAGYIRLARGSNYNAGKGQCGILMEASYPVV